jgi:uncharacterized protein (DUF2062 family)
VSHVKAFARKIANPKKLKYFAAKHLLGKGETPLQKSLALGMGVAIGILPIWGFQMVTALLLASLLKLNKVLAMLATHISFAPMMPLVIFLSFETGRLWMGRHSVTLNLAKGINLKTIQLNLLQYIYGSISLALVAGALSFITCYCLISGYRRQQRIKNVKVVLDD